MTMCTRRLVACFAAAMIACPAVASASDPDVRIEPQASGVDVRLRGISAVDGDIAWASGRKGTVLRTINGGRHWQAVGVPGAEALDFRDIEAFDAETAVVLSIGPGEASRIYHTEDGGGTWRLVLQNRDERAFFDCMDFEGQRGWMLGDPVDGRFQVHATRDGGRHWTLLRGGPEAAKDEAAFAASGTCIARTPWRELLAVTGGGAARAWLGDSGEERWWPHASGLAHRVPAAGVFSAAAMNGDAMLLVGGDFEREKAPGGAARAVFVDDHGLTIEPLPPPRGYRSGAACARGRQADTCIAVGPSGMDLWNGRAWRPLGEVGYDAVDLAGGVGWASGDAGRIARIEIAD